MNFRALTLLAIFLLFQAGGVFASTSLGCSPKTAVCQNDCCQSMTPEESVACCQPQSPDSTAPATPAAPSQTGRELVPAVVWKVSETLMSALLETPVKAAVSWAVHKAGMPPRDAVTLMVLHCAFLI